MNHNKEAVPLGREAIEVNLVQLDKEHQEDLYAFEVANRAYFETMVPSRGDSYYSINNFEESLNTLLEEQRNKLGYYFVIVDQEERIVGRLNLVITDEQSIEVGYRIGENYTGKGFAKKALAEAIKQVELLKAARQLLAKTTSANIGSQRVLERNGFIHTGTDQSIFEWKGKMQQFVYYELHVKH